MPFAVSAGLDFMSYISEIGLWTVTSKESELGGVRRRRLDSDSDSLESLGTAKSLFSTHAILRGAILHQWHQILH